MRLDYESAIEHLAKCGEVPTRRLQLEILALRAASHFGMGQRVEASTVFTALLDTIDDNLSALRTIDPDVVRALHTLPTAPSNRRRRGGVELPRARLGVSVRSFAPRIERNRADRTRGCHFGSISPRARPE